MYLTLRMTDCKDRPQSPRMSYCENPALHPTSWGKFFSSRVWFLPDSPIRCVTCVSNCVKLRCSLKHTIDCVHSGPIWAGFWCRLMLDMCNWTWTTCLELPHNLLFVAVSTGPGWSWEGLHCEQGLASCSSELVEVQLKVQGSLMLASSCQLLCHFLRLPGLPPEPSKEIMSSGPKLATTHNSFTFISMVR